MYTYILYSYSSFSLIATGFLGLITNRHNGKITNTIKKTIDQATLTNIGAGTWNSFSENLRQISDSVMILQINNQPWAPSR